MDDSPVEIDSIYRCLFAYYPQDACKNSEHLELVAENWLHAFSFRSTSKREFFYIAKAAAEISESIPRLQLLLVLLQTLRTNLDKGVPA